MAAVPPPTAEMIADHEKYLNECLELIEKAPWKLSKEEPKIKFYTAPYTGSSFSMVKSVVSVPNAHEKLLNILATIKTIDENTPDEERDGEKECFLLKEFDDEHKSGYLYTSVFSGSRLVSDREFFMLRRHYVIDGKDIWLHCSIKGDDICPPKKGNVRGNITFQMYMAEKDPENEGADKLTFIVHADPCGKVPAMIYNAVAVSQGYSALKIREESLK